MKDIKKRKDWYEFCRKYRYDIYGFAHDVLNMTEEACQEITWQQSELFESVQEPGSRTSVSSGHGCFGYGTPIMLVDGTVKPVQDIITNDVLMGDDGIGTQVYSVVRGRDDLFRFEYEDGISHVFNKSHILCLINHITLEKITIKITDYLVGINDLIDFHPYKYINGNYVINKITNIDYIGIGNFYGFELTGNNKFLCGDSTVLHNTGKTRSAGIIALWHLLCFEDSVTFFTAPQIDQLRKLVWKEIAICQARMYTGAYAWLADYITVTATMVYIKGYDKQWHVVAKTAPKNKPTNLAGQHGDNYLLWVDEAAGVDEAALDVCLNALTHKDNRAVLTSQPVKATGLFFDTHHRLSKAAGSKWNNLTFNSEESPIVSSRTIKEALDKYGSRDDVGYMIRIRGLFPDLTGEFLLSNNQARSIYNGDCIDDIIHDDYGYILTIDIGGGTLRDDSCIAISKVWGRELYGDNARRAELLRWLYVSNKPDQTNTMLGIIEEALNYYPNLTICVDGTSPSTGIMDAMRSKGIYFKPIHWGGECFSKSLRKDYKNKRSQAVVCATRAIAQGRFKVKDLMHKEKFIQQAIQIPYQFDDIARYVVASKKEMKDKGIRSPDMFDVVAFLFLQGVDYSSANDGSIIIANNEKKVIESLEAVAGDFFG